MPAREFGNHYFRLSDGPCGVILPENNILYQDLHKSKSNSLFMFIYSLFKFIVLSTRLSTPKSRLFIVM